MRLQNLPGVDVLVGLTFLDAAKNVERQEQFYGTIDEADEHVTWVSTDDGGDRRSFPTHLAAFRPAPAGRYRLRSTGQVVTDPSLLVSWMLTAEETEEGEPCYDATPNLAPLKRNSRVPQEWDLTYRIDEARIRRTIDRFGDDYIARTVILGINYVGRDGELQAQEQLVGTIMVVDYDEGIVLSCEPDGRQVTLPGDPCWIEKGARAEYRLRSTGQVVVDPDYVAEITIREPD